MRKLVLLTEVFVVSLLFSGRLAQGSSALTYDSAPPDAHVGRNETYDPWMGYRMDMSLKPEIKGPSEAMAFVKTTMVGDDPCMRMAAHLIIRDNIPIHFISIPSQDPTKPTEADYDPVSHVINISDDRPYLRNPENLKKKLVHESFHRVQQILDLQKTYPGWHNYAARPVIVAYLQKQFPDDGQCTLPDVPEDAKGTVPDTVPGGLQDAGHPMYFGPVQIPTTLPNFDGDPATQPVYIPNPPSPPSPKPNRGN